MRGWWRPLVGAAGLGLGFALALGAYHRSVPDEVMLVVLALCALPFGALFLFQAASRTRSFRLGLADAGEPTDIISDDVGWLGERRVVARGTLGDWRLRAIGGRSARLFVTPPGQTRERVVFGSARKNARAAAEALRADAPWSMRPRFRGPAFLRDATPGWRPRLALALCAGSFAAAAAVGVALRPSFGMLFLVGLAAGVGWFVSIVMAFSYAVKTGRDAALPAGVAAGVLFAGLAYAAALALARGDAIVPLVAATGGAAAFALAWWGARGSRLLAGTSAILAAASGFLLPRFFATVGVALAALALVATWSNKRASLSPPLPRP